MWRWRRILWRGWRKYLTVLVASILFSIAANCLTAYIAVTPWGKLPVLSDLGLFLFIGFVLLFLSLPIMLIGLIPSFSRSFCFCILLITFGIVFGINAGNDLSRQLRLRGIRQVTYRLEPLVQAVRNYQMVHDRPPDRLDQLIPAYLLAIPDSGLPKSRPIEYAPFVGASGWEVSIPFVVGDNYHYLTYYEHPEFSVAHSKDRTMINGWVDEVTEEYNVD